MEKELAEDYYCKMACDGIKSAYMDKPTGKQMSGQRLETIF
jgi:hypothetical protein